MGTAKGRRPVRKPAAAKSQAAADAAQVQEVKKPLRPSQCRGHLRKTVADAYRDIVAGFVEQAKSGSCQHLKMATELVEAKRRERASRVKGPAAKFLDDLEAEDRAMRQQADSAAE